MRLLFWILFSLIAPLSLVAQEFVLPSKPSNFIVDETRFYKVEEIDALQHKLQKFKDETGLELFVYAVSYAPLTDIQVLSRTAVSHWEGDEPAMIVGYSRGEDRPYVFPGTKFMNKFALDFVFNFCHALNKDERAQNGPPQDRVNYIIDEIIAEFSRRHQEMELLRAKELGMLRRFMWFGIGGLILLSGLMFLLSRKLTPILLEKIQRTDLPKIFMPIRLQAPFGGGKMACTNSRPSTEEAS